MDLDVAAQIAQKLGRAGAYVRMIEGQGTINSVVVVDDVVVRLNLDRSPEAALREYRKEQWCAEHACEFVRVPRVLDLGIWEDRAYTVSEFVPGLNGAEKSEVAWPILGEMLRKVHEIDGPAVDGIFEDALSPQEHWQWTRELNTSMLGEFDPLHALHVYEREEAPAILRAFGDLEGVEFKFGLCHGDVTPRNLILADQGPPALIDWGCASFGAVPVSDLVQVRTQQLLNQNPSAFEWQDFLEGYGPEARELSPLLPSLVLLKSFDLVRWAIDRCSERVPELVGKAQAIKRSVIESL